MIILVLRSCGKRLKIKYKKRGELDKNQEIKGKIKIKINQKFHLNGEYPSDGQIQANLKNKGKIEAQ